MNQNYPDSTALLTEVNSLDLYKDLVAQLQKDFLYANVMIDLKIDINPALLLEELYHTIYSLIQNKFNDYLNLLYIIDVSEKQVKKLESNDIMEIAKHVTFLILKREWQKVWYRQKYS
ncbi:hypothetical protein [Ascidiimonas sp. W6]|uniref:hypothetical protein n=1 Tax=Ascidiimonas meishanensis TaxID=3128903 RepID=UPI0030EE619F